MIVCHTNLTSKDPKDGNKLNWFFNHLKSSLPTIKSAERVSISSKVLDTNVLQISVLEHLLFSLFISDLPNVLENCENTLYTNDAQTYLHAFPS